MTDVPELRSLFMTKNVKECEGTSPHTSDAEFGEKLSRFSRTVESFLESTLSQDDTVDFPGGGAVDPEMAGENMDGPVYENLCASGGSVPDPMGDFKGDLQGPFPKNFGARAYLSLLSRDGVPSEESLCENFRHLKLSARAFEENPDLMYREASSGVVQKTEGEEDLEADGSGEGSLAFLGATQMEPMVAREGSTGTPVEGGLPLAEASLQREDKVPSVGPAKRIFSPDVPVEGVLKELPAVPGELSSMVTAGSPEPFSADPADPFWSQVSREGKQVGSLQEFSTDRVKNSATVGVARVALSEEVSENPWEHVPGQPVASPVAGSNVYGKGSPAPAEPFQGVSGTLPQVHEMEGEPGSVEPFPLVGGKASPEGVESAGVALSEDFLDIPREHVPGQPVASPVAGSKVYGKGSSAPADPFQGVSGTLPQVHEMEGEPGSVEPFPLVGGKASPEGVESAGVALSEDFLDIPREHVPGQPATSPVAGSKVYGKGTSAPAEPFQGVSGTLPQVHEREGEPGSVGPFPLVGGKASPEGVESAGLALSEEASEKPWEHVPGQPAASPVGGSNAYGKGSPAPAEPFQRVSGTLPQVHEMEGKPGSVEPFPLVGGKASPEGVESAGVDLLSGVSRPDPEAGGVPLGSFVPVDGEEAVPGPDPDAQAKREDASPAGIVGVTAQEGTGGRVLEGSKDLTTGDEDLSSPPVAVNPMEPMSGERVGREVLLEVRGVEAMARGLAETVHVVRKRDGHKGTIEVSPPDIGQVRITIESSGDTVRIHLRVESVQVRDMLDQTADVLKQSMEDRGLSLTGMSVDVGGQGADESSRGWESASESLPGSFGESGEVPVEEAEEVIARLDLERGMLHWVA